MTKPFAGIHAVLYALFDESGELWREGMRHQVELCIAGGVDGIAVLGLATEVGKLTEAERRQVIDWAAEDIGGRVPLAVTIFGNSIPEQLSLLRHAESRGASWVILQPPTLGSYGAAEVRSFFAAVAAQTTLPVAIQNAPALMGRGFTAAELVELVTEHPNITHLKCEMPVLDMQAIVEATGGRLVILNGQGGLELTDNLRAGCDGFILAPDIVDKAVAIQRAWRAGNEGEAERLYGEALPAIVFAMRSLEHLITYGKRLFAERAGLSVHDRAPALRPRPFGLERVADYAKRLGPLPAAEHGQ